MNLNKYSKKQKLAGAAALFWAISYLMVSHTSTDANSLSNSQTAIFSIAFLIMIILTAFFIAFIIYMFVRGFFGKVKISKPRSFTEAAPGDYPMNFKTWVQLISTIIIIAAVGYFAWKHS